MLNVNLFFIKETVFRKENLHNSYYDFISFKYTPYSNNNYNNKTCNNNKLTDKPT